ncbi:hypothetical protein [Nonomuraea basaltis]|uniref:hypothetical protein n=1 Tax=Nonomuraea basaltis TaxID=2495887 RepID=UPI001F0EAE41|nr:hypothetical protein [Nonomuraea basaltis]
MSGFAMRAAVPYTRAIRSSSESMNTHRSRSTALKGMATPEEAQLMLVTIARLADEQGNALDRTFQLFGDGALLGPGATQMHEGLVERHVTVRQAFLRAFDAVEQLATAEGNPPRVDAPHIRQPPAALTPPPGGYVGGSPALMQALDAEFGRVGRDWQEAGRQLSGALSRLDLGTTAGQAITLAGSWLIDQRSDLQRRRAKLLETPAEPAMEGTQTVSGTVGPAPAPVLGMISTLLDVRSSFEDLVPSLGLPGNSECTRLPSGTGEHSSENSPCGRRAAHGRRARPAA